MLVVSPFLLFSAKAEEPDLEEVLAYLGFTSIIESSDETFSAGTYNFTLYAEFAGWHDENELSYYQVGTSVFSMIFAGPEGDGDGGYVVPPINKSFTIGYQFGLSMLSHYSRRYYTETSRNGDGLQHAKVYENQDAPGMYLIGFENQWGGGDRDYNDMVFSLKPYAPPVNNPPVAVGDSYSTNEDTLLSVSAPGVLGNDTDVDLDSLTAVWVSDPSHGTLTLNSDGSFTYAPDADWNGVDSFTYKAYDGQAYSNVATVYITVNPVLEEYTLTVNVDPVGSGSVNLNATGPYDYGEVVELTANPNWGWTFDHWSGGLTGSTNPDTIVMDGDKTVTAHFTQITYTLTITATSGGTTSPSLGAHVYSSGTNVPVTAIPQGGYQFDHWELDSVNVGSANPYAVTMNADHILHAVFEEAPSPPPAVGGYALPINLDLGTSISLIPRICLASALFAIVAATIILVRRKKKTLEQER